MVYGLWFMVYGYGVWFCTLAIDILTHVTRSLGHNIDILSLKLSAVKPDINYLLLTVGYISQADIIISMRRWYNFGESSNIGTIGQHMSKNPL